MVISRLGGGGGGSSEGAKFYIKVDLENVSIGTLYAEKEGRTFSESYTGSTAQIEVDNFGTYDIYAVVNGAKTDVQTVEVTTEYTDVQTITIPIPSAIDVAIVAEEDPSDDTKAKFSYAITKPADVDSVKVFLGTDDTSSDFKDTLTGEWTGLDQDTQYNFVTYAYNKFGLSTKGAVATASYSASKGFKSWVASRSSTASIATFEDLDTKENEDKMRELMTVHASQDILVDWMTNTPSDFDQFANSRLAMKWIGLRDRVCDKLMAMPDIYAKMMASQYWEYILKDKVPVMASDTAPEGKMLYNTSNSVSPAWRAFDGNDTTLACVNDSNPGSYMGYQFVEPICVNKIKIRQHDTQRVFTISVKAFNDDISNAVTLLENQNVPHNFGEDIFYTFDNTNYYLNYIIVFSNTKSGVYSGLYTLQFYGRALNESVPVMTDYDKPIGKITDSDHYSGNEGWRAFNKDVSGNSKWNPTYVTTHTVGEWVEYEFPKLVSIKQAVFYTKILMGFTLQAYVNNTWQSISEEIKCTSSNDKKYTIIVNKNITTKRIRLLATSYEQTGKAFYIFGANFYGVSYSEEEFGSDGIDMLYDNGVNIGGVSAMGTYTGRANGTTQSLDDYFYSKSTGAYMPSIGARIDNTTGKYKAVISEYKEKTLSSNTVYLASATINNGGWNPNVESYIDIISGKNSGQVARGRNVINIANAKLNNYLFSAPYTESSNNECKTTKLWLLKA